MTICNRACISRRCLRLFEDQPCSNNYGSSGVQVIAPFACAFSVGKLAGDTIVPTGISLTGPAGATCTDNYGSSGTQVPAQN